MSKTVCIIPARWGSTRFPGKPLAPIVGATGISRPLLVRTMKQAVKAECFDSIYVATDSPTIADYLDNVGLGNYVVMTSPDHTNGTERVAEAARKLDLNASDIVINLQGDAVLTPAGWLSTLVASMRDRSSLLVTTFVYPRYAFDVPSPGDVEALLSGDQWALYFTRGPIPKSVEGWYQHFGIYGYRAGILHGYVEWGPSRREVAESLEQLRFVERGIGIKCIVPGLPGGIYPEREVNYPDDIAAVEEVLRKWNIE